MALYGQKEERKMMGNLNRIGERVMEISEDSEFIRENFSFLDEENFSKFSHARVIYANLPYGRLFIEGYVLTQDMFDKYEKGGNPGVPGEDFKLFLLYAKPETFNDLLIILRVYFSLIYGKYVVPLLPLKPFSSQDPIVDTILHETNGHLVWVYQLEKLIGLFEPNIATIMDQVKAVRRRDETVFEWMATKFVCNGLTLKDIVEKQMLLGQVHRPEMQAAFKLYRLLFTDEIDDAKETIEGGNDEMARL